MKKIVVFASGSGSNAENIVNYFRDKEVKVLMFLTNNPNAGVIERGRRLGIPTLVFDKKTFSKTNDIVNILKNLEVDFIVLGGFLWMIPENLISSFDSKIVNIHPSLLPKYGGKGMWGHFVHEAVLQNNESESGISIHLVNEHYDEGEMVFQAKCTIDENETPESLAAKVQELEAMHFPKIIENLLYPL